MDIFRISEKIELDERLLSAAKPIKPCTESRLRSLPVRSTIVLCGWLEGGFELMLGVNGSTGKVKDDLLLIVFSSASVSSSVMVGAWWFTMSFSFSSTLDWWWSGEVGGDCIIDTKGGGEGVRDWIDCCESRWWVSSHGEPCDFWDFGESGGSLMQIEACWTVNLFKSLAVF